MLGGKCLILRTEASGDVWQFRMWVSEEKKYVRKTLGTRDFKTAIERAETLCLQLYSDVASGKKSLVDEDFVGRWIAQGRSDAYSSRIPSDDPTLHPSV